MAEPKTSKDAFQPNWRHFRPSDVVYVQNPFDREFSWFVYDDEKKQQIRCSIQPNGRAELTSGMIHTLGVKAIVDELIQQDGNKLQIWDPLVRAKYEDKIIIKVKEAQTSKTTITTEGVVEVDLTTKGSVPEISNNEELAKSARQQPTAPVIEEETEFPDAQVPTVQADDPLVVAATAGQPDTIVQDE